MKRSPAERRRRAVARSRARREQTGEAAPGWHVCPSCGFRWKSTVDSIKACPACSGSAA